MQTCGKVTSLFAVYASFFEAAFCLVEYLQYLLLIVKVYVFLLMKWVHLFLKVGPSEHTFSKLHVFESHRKKLVRFKFDLISLTNGPTTAYFGHFLSVLSTSRSGTKMLNSLRRFAGVLCRSCLPKQGQPESIVSYRYH